MMTDMEVTLNPGLLPAFTDDATVVQESPNVIANNRTIVMEQAAPEPSLLFPPPMNTTFFVNQSSGAIRPVEEDEDSIVSSDTPSAIMFETEQKMRDSIKAIQFKEMLMARDRHSREIILRRCIEWLQMPTSRRRDRTLDWFTSLSALKTAESIENSYLWHTLYDSGIFACESFKTVISFFDAI
jgi:hypothetical protein